MYVAGEPKETVWYQLKFDIKGEAMVYERRRIKGCFLENLELDEFPFDTQVRQGLVAAGTVWQQRVEYGNSG